MRIKIPYKWQPRDYQYPLWEYLEDGGRRAIEIWHRRSGKDEVCLHWAAVSAQEKPATYWHMLPEAAQARKAIWEAINPHTGKRRIDEAFPKEIRKTTREQEMLIKFKTGATWQVVGSDNYNSLVGSPPYGVVFSEWALANPQAWAYLRPILRENGGWAVFITTPRGNNHAKTMLNTARLPDSAWHHSVLPATGTSVFAAADLEEELKEYMREWGPEQGRALFDQEYLCSFEAAFPGAYFAAEMRLAQEQGRICQIPYEPGIPVNTFWDLGIDDSMTIWFHQAIPALSQHRFIDYYECSGVGLAHYANVLFDKRVANGWLYGRHVAPHDIKVRELGTGKSRWETARNLKENGQAKMSIDFEIAHRPDNKEDAIEVARQALSKCWFDIEKCETGTSALSSYRKKLDELNKVWMKTPLHDWASHGADAFQTFAASFDMQIGGMQRALLAVTGG